VQNNDLHMGVVKAPVCRLQYFALLKRLEIKDYSVAEGMQFPQEG